MKKLCVIFTSLLLILINGAWIVLADGVPPDRFIGDNVVVHADVVPPQRQAYATYHIEYPDLTQSEMLSVDTLADRLFYDVQSERTYKESRDAQYKEGGDWVENRSGEHIWISQLGMVTYMQNEGELNYERALSRVMAEYCYDEGMISIDAAELDRDLAFAGRDQVLNEVQPLIDTFADACGLTARLACFISIDHSFLQKNAESLSSYDGVDPKEYTADWDESKDMYILGYCFSQDELPIFHQYLTDHTLISQSQSTASSFDVLVYVNSAGVYALEAKLGELSLLEEPRRILTPEQALDHLEGYLEQLIIDEPIQIVRMYLCYLPIKTSKSLSEGKLIPAWCFAAVIEEMSMRQVYLMNAFSGEILP